MGVYLNPKDQTKESFLIENGIAIPRSKFTWEACPNGFLPVVLVDNSIFSAAAVAYDEKEFNRLTRNDKRSRQFFYVEIEKLSLITSELESYLSS